MKIISRGLAKKDDPMFSKGVEIFFVHKHKQSTEDTKKTVDNDKPKSTDPKKNP